MRTALIGYTGFVGSNIAAQHHFDDLYNSSNIADIEGKSYDLVVSAGNRSEMWRINQEGEKDLAEIKGFISHIVKAKIAKLVLISTIGIYKVADGVDEDTPIGTEGLTPYGVNRYYLETYCHDHFDAAIIRLPGLFGEGLKKNVIFDLINDNMVDRIHKDGSYQYYNLANIWKDISTVLNHGLSLVNFGTPPIKSSEVAKVAFGMDFTNAPADIKPAVWDMRTKYAEIFGSKDGYICSKDQELEDIKAYVAKHRA